MEILLLLIPVSVLLVLLIGAAFWWSVRSGQFDDLDGPAHRILADDDSGMPAPLAKPDDPAGAGRTGELTSINPAPRGAGRIPRFGVGEPPGTR
jgi:cbb3-type cytochrome oxidase maturation protein